MMPSKISVVFSVIFYSEYCIRLCSNDSPQLFSYSIDTSWIHN